MLLLQDSIRQNEISPDNAGRYLELYLYYTNEQLKALIKQSPSGLKGPQEFSGRVEEAIKEAKEGDYYYGAKFLRAEADRLRYKGDSIKRIDDNVLGKQLTVIADMVSPESNSPAGGI